MLMKLNCLIIYESVFNASTASVSEVCPLKELRIDPCRRKVQRDAAGEIHA
jgi:hypothetical protein